MIILCVDTSAPSLVSDAVVVSNGWHALSGLVRAIGLPFDKRNQTYSCKCSSTCFVKSSFCMSPLRSHRWTKRLVPVFRKTGFLCSRKNLGFGVILGLKYTLLLLIVGDLILPVFLYFLSGYNNTHFFRLLGRLSQGVLCFIRLFPHLEFPLISSFQLKLFIRKETARSRSKTIDISSPPFIGVFGRDSGNLGDQAPKDFVKKPVVGLRKHFSKAADNPLNFIAMVEKPS